MRAGYKYVSAGQAGGPRSQVDATAAEFAQTMGYAGRGWTDRKSFLDAHAERWILELHEALLEFLDPARPILSVGSGVGEHDVRLALAGLDVTATDVVPGVLEQTAALFPELKTAMFDVFAPTAFRCQDVLITGMDFYFDDARAVTMLRNLAGLVGPGGRVLFTLRYPDTPATLLIDRVLLPLVALAGRLRGRKLVRKHHGWRRSQADVIELAGRAGLRPGRTAPVALGYEAARLGWDPDRFARLDRRTGVLTGATVIELHA